MTTTTEPAVQVFEARFDALLTRLRSLSRSAPMTVRPAVKEITEELAHLRRDMTALPHLDLAPPPTTAVRPGSTSGRRVVRIGNHRYYAGEKERDGKRHCPRCNEDEGAWLPVAEFDVKNPATGALRSWCRACTKAYQRERYVSVTARTMTVQLLEGDRCVGRDCPGCGLPFEIGERITGESLRHEACKS